MPRFNYVALDARGQEAAGLVEAASTNAAITQLRQAGYFPTSVVEEAISGPDGKEALRRAATMVSTTRAAVVTIDRFMPVATQNGPSGSRVTEAAT